MGAVSIELLKAGLTLGSVALGAGIGFFFYFRQKEYELTKQRYLDEGLDVVAARLDSVLGVVSHNYARSLQLCRQYRDLGSQFQPKEVERGFLELDNSKFQQVAHYRVGSLLGDQVVWEVFQAALAFASSANMLIAQEIPDTLRILAAEREDTRDRRTTVEGMFNELRSRHCEGLKFALLSKELHALVLRLEERRLSRKEVATFRDRPEVQATISRLREAFSAIPTGDDDAAQPVAGADVPKAASPP
jgi:hypothetical protein